uniref:translocation protein SEC62 n=1 Tax=Panthera onca TaxID=9690 RepID=UPI002952BD52|nr:translocation protein SEC62 [Panthera onca]
MAFWDLRSHPNLCSSCHSACMLLARPQPPDDPTSPTSLISNPLESSHTAHRPSPPLRTPNPQTSHPHLPYHPELVLRPLPVNRPQRSSYLSVRWQDPKAWFEFTSPSPSIIPLSAIEKLLGSFSADPTQYIKEFQYLAQAYSLTWHDMHVILTSTLTPEERERIQEVGEPSKEEKAVAKYLRFNCPTKSTNMMGHRVDYFIASKAVDCLLDSKWAKAKKGEEALFTTRESVVDYCNRLLKKQFFHRALKVMKMKYDKDIKKEKEKGKAESGKEEDKKSRKENLKDEKTKKEKEKKKDGEKEESKKEETPGTPKKKETKKKFKLEPHDDQVFLDGNEVFVWIYDPVHFKTFVMGLILVIAVIAATLFPLWPAEMRVGVYYLSVGAGCFVASILLLAVARCILFLIIWLITGGRHHFWFLPNLTADVGFIDSFRPLYTHEYKGPKADLKKDEKSEAKKQQKSDSEEKSDSEKKEDEEGKVGPGNPGTEGSGGERHSDTDSDRREDDRSQHSSGNGNDFEMITKEELEQQTDGDCEEEEEEDNDGETTKSSHEKS